MWKCEFVPCAGKVVRARVESACVSRERSAWGRIRVGAQVCECVSCSVCVRCVCVRAETSPGMD